MVTTKNLFAVDRIMVRITDILQLKNYLVLNLRGNKHEHVYDFWIRKTRKVPK